MTNILSLNEQKSILLKCFNEIDENGDGTLNVDELKKAF